MGISAPLSGSHRLLAGLCLAVAAGAQAAAESMPLEEPTASEVRQRSLARAQGLSGEGPVMVRSGPAHDTDSGSVTPSADDSAWRASVAVDETVAADRRIPVDPHTPAPSLLTQAEPGLYWFIVIVAMLVLVFFAGRQRIK